MKIVLMESLGISNELLEKYCSKYQNLGHEVIAYDTKAKDNDELIQRGKEADVLVIANRPLPNEVIQEFTNLKFIDVAFTGVDHVGLNACEKQGIVVSNASGYSNVSVSELVIGQVLALYRYIITGNQVVRSGGTSAGLVGMEIKGKTVGIIGTGHIGIETAKLFKAFGARVLGWSRSIRQEAIDAGIEYVELNTLLETCDIVSLHLPMNATTKHFFDEEKINRMKTSAILINCARGGVVDNVALAKALNNGVIAGAAIDVFDMEPPLSNDYCLLNSKNCLLSPHVAFLTKEAMVRRAEIVFDNLNAYLNNCPINLVKW